MTQRLLALDGLRAVAVLTVLSSHIITSLIPASLGVTLFFFISGFIITRMLLEDAGSLAAFYIRRFFRLYPALVCYIALSAVTMHFAGEVVRWDGVAAGLLFYTNYIPETVGYFTHLWSLSVEEHFYILFPLLVIFLRRDRLPALLIACIVVALIARFYEFRTGYDHGALQAETHTRLDSIAYGCLLSVMFHRAQTSIRIRRMLDLLSTRPAMAVGVLLLTSSFAIRSEEFRQTLRFSVQGLAFVLLFCAIFWGNKAPSLLVRVLESRLAAFIGAISYSLYLFHQLARMVTFRLGFPQFTVENIFLSFAITVPLALLSYYLVEGPFRRYGATLAQRRISVRAPLTQAP
jgi:peptidoglycan/LPS O-acetylase OafA/YrhL